MMNKINDTYNLLTYINFTYFYRNKNKYKILISH